MRFCPGDVNSRVDSHDGVPLDVNVTLPADAATGRSRSSSSCTAGAARSRGVGRRRKPWADRGYAVLNYTARGFGQSCGSAASRTADPTGCAQGWIHLGRHALRGPRHPAPGRPAGRRGPDRAQEDRRDRRLLRRRPVACSSPRCENRIRNPNGRYSPWKSPRRQGHADRRRGAGDPVVRPRLLADAQRAHARLRRSTSDTARPEPAGHREAELRLRPVRARARQPATTRPPAPTPTPT